MNPQIGNVSGLFDLNSFQLFLPRMKGGKYYSCAVQANCILNIKTPVGQNSVAWQKFIEKATVLSKSLVAESTALAFGNKAYRSLWSNRYQVVMFVRAESLGFCKKVTRPLNKHLEAVDHRNACWTVFHKV